jgi:iron complex transport system substrate-binding protein
MKTGLFIKIVMIIVFLDPVFTALASPPRRIVSCAPNFTEILFALGLGEQVVGVTDFCRYPPEALKKERIGGFLNPNLEKVIYLNPDLVILPQTKSQLGAKIQKLNLPVIELPNESLSDSLNAIETIGETTGIPERGRALRTKLERELDLIRGKYKKAEKVRTLIVVDRSPDALKDLYASAPGTYLNEILEIAGGTNILSRQPALYPKISKESLIGLNPEVILDTTLAGQNYTSQTLQAALRSWEDLPLLDAVKNKRVYLLTNPAVTIQGPRLAETAGYIAELLHERRGR